MRYEIRGIENVQVFTTSKVGEMRSNSNIVVRAVFDRPSGSYVELAERMSRVVSVFDGATSTHVWRVANDRRWEGDVQARANLLQSYVESKKHEPVKLQHGIVASLGCWEQRPVVELRFSDGWVYDSPRSPSLWCVFDLNTRDGSSVPELIAGAAMAALVMGLVPMQVTLSTVELNGLAKRGGWKVGTGRQLWLRDDIAQFDALPEGVSSERLENGTLLKVDPTWDDQRVVAAMAEIRERYGLDQLPH